MLGLRDMGDTSSGSSSSMRKATTSCFCCGRSRPTTPAGDLGLSTALAMCLPTALIGRNCAGASLTCKLSLNKLADERRSVRHTAAFCAPKDAKASIDNSGTREAAAFCALAGRLFSFRTKGVAFGWQLAWLARKAKAPLVCLDAHEAAA